MVDAGYTSDGEPGPRPEYGETYYGAFVLDPGGNSVEAVHHRTSRTGALDHLWLRARDVPAQKRLLLRDGRTGRRLRVSHDDAARVQFTDGVGSFSFVSGEPLTENVHLAFAARDRETVDEFHRLAVAVGYRDTTSKRSTMTASRGHARRPAEAAGGSRDSKAP